MKCIRDTVKIYIGDHVDLMIFIGGELGSVAKSPLAKGDWWRKILWWKCSGGERVRWQKGIGGERVRWRKSQWRMGLWWKGLWRIAPWRKLQHPYSLQKEVCINFCGSTTLFLNSKEGSLKRKRIQIQIYVSILQNVWVILGPFYVLVFHKMYGLHWVPLKII